MPSAPILPLGPVVTPAADRADNVERARDEFIRTIVDMPLGVRVISILGLGLRFGIVVARSVPIVLPVLFVIRQAMGLSFDRVTFGALIIALGFRSITRSSL